MSAEFPFYDLLTSDPEAALRDVIARRELHRACTHQTRDPDAFFDCGACGVLDNQLARAERATGRAR
jgi:hypothetical protein